MDRLPKIELHCHLDGSVRPDTVYELTKQLNLNIETNKKINIEVCNRESFNDYLVAPLDCDSLKTYLDKFDLPISVLQSKEALTRSAFELVEDNALENVKYLEIRFDPIAHTQKGLSLSEVIESVLEGTHKGQDSFDIIVNVILAFNRKDTLDELNNLIHIAKDYIDQGVVAIDLCGLETESFVRKFIKPIKLAKEAGFQVTIHAGETGYSQNVIEAVEYLDVKRIGHGVAIIQDQKSMAFISNSDVLLEVCPTSNIQTKAFISYEEHPINVFMDKGINISVGTDNRTVSNVTLSDEYKVLEKTFDWKIDHFRKVFNMSIEAAFANSKTKEWLRTISREFYGDENSII